MCFWRGAHGRLCMHASGGVSDAVPARMGRAPGRCFQWEFTWESGLVGFARVGLKGAHDQRQYWTDTPALLRYSKIFILSKDQSPSAQIIMVDRSRRLTC